jgi:hypothetical protein
MFATTGEPLDQRKIVNPQLPRETQGRIRVAVAHKARVSLIAVEVVLRRLVRPSERLEMVGICAASTSFAG